MRYVQMIHRVIISLLVSVVLMFHLSPVYANALTTAGTTPGPTTTTEQCTGFRCFVSRECLSYVKFCNGVPDCADGTDEYPAVCSSNEPLGVCQPITPSAEFICTHLLPYENTSLPNYLNQTTQTASLPAALALNRASGCHPSFSFLVCTTLFPKCEDDQQTTPCRELCDEVRASCEGPLQAIGEEWPKSCEDLPSRDDVECLEPTSECEPIQYSGCMGLSYSQTSFPNIFQWPTQDIALQVAPTVFPTYDQISDCHPDLNFFLCSIFFPQCTSEGQILPCRSFCYEINATCGERALAAGVEWDASICPRLSEDSCSLPNADRATTPANTTPGSTTTTEQCTGFRCFVSRECLSYVKFCNGVPDCADGTDEYPAVCSSNEPLGVCQPITPSAEFICTHLLPYENTSLPNYLNQTSQTASLPAALALNRASECHPSFSFLVCTTLFPKCEDDQQTPPCRELCDEVRASCEGPLQDIGEEWPRSCEDLPSRDDAECLEPTSGACEPFPQAFQGICEPLTGYNTVSFPNAFGHLSFQQMITSREYLFFGSNLGNISTSCYPSVYTAFCRMFLPQCDNGTQGNDPTCSLVEQAAECEPIQYSGCMGLSYSQTSFPNIFQWPTQDFALQAAPTVFPTYDSISDCHPDLNFFLCSILFPQCTSEGQILPCRSFCHEINATCGERALAAGVEWDASICPLLSEDNCSLPTNALRATTPAGTTPGPTITTALRATTPAGITEGPWTTPEQCTGFRCAVSGECLSYVKYCNGVPDCTDRTDEIFCSNNDPHGVCQPITPSAEFICTHLLPYRHVENCVMKFEPVVKLHCKLSVRNGQEAVQICRAGMTRNVLSQHPIQLCRSVCEEMDARCSPVGLGLPFSCDVFLDRGDDPTCSLVEQPAECEPIRYSGCMGLSYSQTSFPNVLQWPSQDVALGAAPFVFPQFDQISDCHPDLNFFLCSVFFPQCTSEGQIPPCRSFCYEINATCGERALAVGAQWDASICPQLPEDNCSLPNAGRATTPASTTPGPTTTTASRATASASTTEGPRTTAEQCTGFRCFVSRECLSYVKFCNGVQDCADGTDEYPAVCSSNEPLGVCQPITPSAEFICTHLLPYENTSLPNYLNQTSQTASLPAALALNRASGCHPSFSFLVCTTLFPKCEDDQQVSYKTFNVPHHAENCVMKFEPAVKVPCKISVKNGQEAVKIYRAGMTRNVLSQHPVN
ncbi:CORIN [Branchiostoma lanceolatum]|uniref:CORIN protein n=1 Tax=Branchiostoma lanceolatum TaxID=7740 RepID=A0A8J9ZRK8_BRALA|nr:CORIN [Branchiostoma lanceolatum]